MNERLKDLRMILIFGNIANMVFQGHALLWPYNQRHFDLNLAYSILTVILTMMQALTFKDEKYMKLMLLNSFLWNFRMMFRVMDFENTYRHIGTANWMWLVAM